MTSTTDYSVHTSLRGDQIEESMRQGWQLPAELYSDPAYYDLDRAKIFTSAWQYMCRTDQLQNPGDYVTATLGDTPVVIVRDTDG